MSVRKLILDSYQRNIRVLNESFESIDTLKSKLNPIMVSIMNDSVGGSSDWSNSDKWSDANNSSDSVETSNALIEIFIQYACKSWGCTLAQLDPGKDILISLIDQLGFKDNENPYLKFMKTFFSGSGKGVTLSEDDWIKLNDWYANEVIEASDLMGTGRDRENHIIFNPYLYSQKGNISSDMDNMVEAYSYLSEPNNVSKLNLYAAATFNGSPYGALKSYTSGGTRGSGKITDSSKYKEVRNIIIYKDPTNVMGPLHTLYNVKKAINIGDTNIYSGDKDTGTSSATRLRRSAYATMSSLSETDRLAVLQQLIDAGLLKTR